MTFPLGTAPSYYATCSFPNARHGIFYVGDSVTITLSQSTPTAYYVKDYYGTTVSSGSTSGTTCTPTPPGGGWLPGWYRIYFTGANTDAVYGPSYGATNFCVIRANSHFPTLPSPSVKGNGSPGHHGVPPDLITRGCMGMATARLSIVPMPDPNSGTADRLSDIALDAPLATTWWTQPPDNDTWEQGRSRYLWVAFSNQAYDRLTAGGTVSFYPKDETQVAHADKIFVSTSAGTVSGDKYVVYYPDASTVVETYDNQADAVAAAAVINAASAYIWMFGPSGRPSYITATAIGNAYYTGVKLCSSTLFPLGIPYYEGPINEPGIGRYLGQQMRMFRAAVKAGNPDAQVIGPCPVDITNPAWSNFFISGGLNYIDALSFHDYNTAVCGDLNQGRTQIEAFLALLAANGWTGPLWQTEAQSAMTCVYGVHHPRRARTCMLHMLLWEQYGIPRERNCYWYDVSIGFWGFPVWAWNGDESSQPQVPMYRTLTEETFNMPHHHRVYFGSPAADAIFLGSVYGSSTTLGPSTLVLISASHIPGATVTISVAGTTSPLTVVDAFGNTSTVTISSGLAVIPVDDVPTYVRLPAGVTVTVSSVLDWGTSPHPNVAALGAATLGGAATPDINDGQFLNLYAAYPGGIGIAYSPVTVPDDIAIAFDQAVTVDRVIIWCGPCWQSMGVLVDFDIDTSSDGVTWTTRTTVTKTTPSSFNHGTSSTNAGCKQETYSDEQWIFPVTLPSPVSCQYIRAHVRATSYGGEPDAAAVAAGGQGRNEQRVAVEEMMVMSSTVPTLPGQYDTEVLADSPNGYWKLAEASGATAVGQVNSPALDGVYSATCVLGVPGPLSSSATAVSLPNASPIADIQIPNNSLLNLGATDVLTVECWFKPPPTISSTRTIVERGSGRWGISLLSTGFVQFAKPGVAGIVTSTVACSSGWNHVVATKSGADIHIYLNGVDVSGTVTNTALTDGSGVFYIGDNAGASTFADGQVACVALYPTALTAARVLAHYKAGLRPQVPVNTVAPAIVGSTRLGMQLSCTTGVWTGGATGYAYQWKRDGSNVSTGPHYLKTSADIGHSVTCTVTASNAAGSASQTSNSITVAAAQASAVGMVSI